MMSRLLFGACLLSCGCDDLPQVDGGPPPGDGGGGELGVYSDGGGPLRGAFTIIGCDTLDQSEPSPICSGRAPLALTFVPLGAGVSTFVWEFEGGDPPTSRLVTPSVIFAKPGTYDVSLAAGGAAGTTVSGGQVKVLPGALGAACGDPSDCDLQSGLTCLCAQGSCPGGPLVGLCTRQCDAQLCASGELCVDLTRGAPPEPVDAGASDGGQPGGSAWRRALCLPACATPGGCRAGLTCRDLPVLKPGAAPGSAYAWQKGCFADVLGEVGDSCALPTGAPASALCLSGHCEAWGARGLCTADCGAMMACPTSAACATFTGAPLAPRCLRRCDALHPCSDPQLSCEAAGKPGPLGFSVPAGDPPATTYCAPKP